MLPDVVLHFVGPSQRFPPIRAGNGITRTSIWLVAVACQSSEQGG